MKNGLIFFVTTNIITKFANNINELLHINK